ncbi:MAG: hypothetical protein ACLP1X_22810 [Polyangiaceae bacterium]
MRRLSLTHAIQLTVLTGSTMAFAQKAQVPPPVAPVDEETAVPSDQLPQPPTAPGTPTAVASEDAPPAPSGPIAPGGTIQNARVWYGNQTLYADLAGAALGTIAIAVGEETHDGRIGGSIGAVGYFTYLLGGPIVHLEHHRGWTALGDFALRLFGPAATAVLVGLPIGGLLDGVDGVVGGLAVGAGAGAVAIAAIDAAGLAWEPSRIAPTTAGSHPFGLSLAPMVRIVRDKEQPARTVIGLAGVFQ